MRFRIPMKTLTRSLVDHAAGALTFLIIVLFRSKSFVVPFVATAVYYTPALRNSSVDAGFLYTGDVLGYFWPLLLKTHALLSSLHFTAIDFSNYNGSADFFLTPNFFAVHPVFVIYSLVMPKAWVSTRGMGHLLTFALALHSFLACYFTSKLLVRFYGFNFGAASFASIVFAFSVTMIDSLVQPEFVFCAALVPWIVYSALVFSERPSVVTLLLSCMPVLMCYLGGYIPMGGACLALALALVAIQTILNDPPEKLKDERLYDRARRFVLALVPFGAGTFVASPYLFSVYSFVKQSPSANSASIFYSAHQLSETPSSILRALSPHLTVTGPFYEFSVTVGLLSLTIAGLFVSSPKTFDQLRPRDWTIVTSFSIIYFATILSIYGQFSVVSDLVYYFIPQIGSMHIYQRFLLPANLLLAVLIAVMLRSLVEATPTHAVRGALALLILLTMSAAFIVGRNPALTEQLGINNYVIVELFLCTLFVFFLLLPHKTLLYGIAAVIFSLPTLDKMYDYSLGGNTFAQQKARLGVSLDDQLRSRLVAFLKRNTKKELIKYVDVTPMWTKSPGIETFPKSFPDTVLNEINLSSYGGFAFYLATQADYMLKMPVQGDVQVMPDWNYVANSGADFVIARRSDLGSPIVPTWLKILPDHEVFELPNDVVVIPLRSFAEASDGGVYGFDNGYFRISPKVARTNIALGKTARQISTYQGASANRATDGRTSGNFEESSVTHTNLDVNAWLEVDLGSVEPIDSVSVWNRTDCCSERRQNFWVLISQTPFSATDTADEARARSSTWSTLISTPSAKHDVKVNGAHGRYVRIQFSGKQPLADSYLSLAELEVFRSEPSVLTSAAKLQISDFKNNKANHLSLEFQSDVPSTVEYLPWPNRRLKFYINGRRADVRDINGVSAMEVQAGNNKIEVRYSHLGLTAFWIVYGLFTALWLFAVAASSFNSIRQLQWPRSTEYTPSHAHAFETSEDM